MTAVGERVHLETKLPRSFRPRPDEINWYATAVINKLPIRLRSTTEYVHFLGLSLRKCDLHMEISAPSALPSVQAKGSTCTTKASNCDNLHFKCSNGQRHQTCCYRIITRTSSAS